MDNTTLTAIGIGVVVVLLIAAYVVSHAVRKRRLRSHFGPEYTRAVHEVGDERLAEAQLHQREKRVKTFHLKPLSATDRARFTEAWRGVQARFVDSPKDAVAQADVLLTEVMTVRGYPMTDFEQRAADLSVEHPVVVDKYRSAHDVAIRHARGEAGTEDLRLAMVDYRHLFEELVGEPEIRAKAS